MPNQVIAKIVKVKFIEEPTTQTVSYTKAAKTFADQDSLENNIRAVIASDTDTAIKMLARELRTVLSVCWWRPDPKDFSFDAAVNGVEDGGYFWNTSNVVQHFYLKYYI